MLGQSATTQTGNDSADRDYAWPPDRQESCKHIGPVSEQQLYETILPLPDSLEAEGNRG